MAAAVLCPPARIISTAVLLAAATRGRRRVGLSPLLRTSSGFSRAARADFDPRAPRPRGGDASLARGGSGAPSGKITDAGLVDGDRGVGEHVGGVAICRKAPRLLGGHRLCALGVHSARAVT